MVGDWGERRGEGGGKGKVGLSERKICRCYTKGYITEMIRIKKVTMHIDIFVCIPVVIFRITLIDNDPLTSDINKIYILKNLFVYIYSARLIVLL